MKLPAASRGASSAQLKVELRRLLFEVFMMLNVSIDSFTSHAVPDRTMKRNISKFLANWKQEEKRKVLLLRGARQAGKTITVQVVILRLVRRIQGIWADWIAPSDLFGGTSRAMTG